MISIIIPVYNCQDFLKECLESILRQTYQNFEIICIDDKSSDHSPQILQEYAARDTRIKFIQTETNCGSGPARNRGIAEAKGDYILFCDADDMYHPSTLHRLRSSLIHTGCDICAGNIKLMSHDMSYPVCPPPPLMGTYIDECTVARPFDCPQFWVPWYHPRFMFKKSFLVENNICYPNLLRGEDPPMLAKALCLCKMIATIPDTVYYYRISSAKKYSPQQFSDYISHIKQTISILDSFGHTRQADIYVQLMAYFADGFQSFKAFSPQNRRTMIDFCLTLLSKRSISKNIFPYRFDEYIPQRLSSMKYGILVYGLFRIYTLYGKKIKNYLS